MHIALCDDCREDARQLAEMMERYAVLRRTPLQVTLFSQAEDLLEAARQENFQCCFLDILMPGMNGMDLAGEIRRGDQDVRIVFLSSFNDFAHQSYRVKAWDYLLKPAQEAEIFDLLDRLRAQEADVEECICLQNGRSVFRLPCERLACVEVNQKQLYFYLTDGQLRRIPGRMADVEKQLLTRKEFVKIHRSYVVNLQQVSVMSPEGCEMFSGLRLPVSRLMYNQVRRAYMDHLFRKEE